MSKYLNYPNFGLLILRIFLGICVLYHGLFKLKFGIEPVTSLLVNAKIPSFLSYFVYLGEILAPIMIIFGIYTRFASIMLIATSGMILYVAYMDKLLAVTNFGGLMPEIVYLYLGASLCLLFCGGGKFSIKND